MVTAAPVRFFAAPSEKRGMCAPFCPKPVQLSARTRALFHVKNVRVRTGGHIGSVTYVSSPVTYLGEVRCLRVHRLLHAAR